MTTPKTYKDIQNILNRTIVPSPDDNPESAIIDDIETQKKLNQLENDSLLSKILAQERLEIMQMRKKWSLYLLYAVIAIIVFDFIVISAVGLDIMKFKNGYIIPLVIGESFLKTIGLALIVVNFLFDKSNTLKNKFTNSPN